MNPRKSSPISAASDRPAAESARPGLPAIKSPVEENSLTGSTLRGMLWMSWGKAGRAVLQFGVLAVLARLIAPAEFGLVSAGFVVISFAAVFAHIGLGKGLVQHPSLRPEHIAVALHSSVLLGLLLAVVVWYSATALAGFFRVEALAPVLRVMAITFLLKAFAIVPEALLQRELKFQWLANRELASYAIGYGCVGIALAFAGWGAWALVAAHLAQTAASTLLLLFARRIPFKVWPERQAFSDLLFFSGGYTLGRVANHIASEGDNLVVGRTLGPVALGIYGRAFQLMAVPADSLGDILDNVLFPTMAKAQHDSKRLATAYRRGVSLIALVMLPLSVVFFLLAPQIVAITLGPKWNAAVVPFQFLAIGLLFRTSCRMSDALARAKGFVYGRAWRQGLYAALVLGGAWVGQHWSIAGAALGVCVALCINFLLMAQLSLKIADMSWASFIKAHIPAFLLACSLGITVRLTSSLMAGSSLPPWVLLAGASIVAVCTMCALTFALPRLFVGRDGLWMLETLRAHFPILRYLRFSPPLTPEAEVKHL